MRKMLLGLLLSFSVAIFPLIPVQAAAFSVGSYGFSPNPITLGQSGNANISITGGTAGTYTLIIWRDISLWPDEQVTTFQIAHTGATTTKSFQFTPAIAASYHMSLVLSGTNLWSQPDDASRLTVRSPPTTSFAVTSYSFSPNPITLGQSGNANISITGGTAGTYTLIIWRGISLWPDEQVTTFQITHAGTTTTKSFPFTAAMAASYHMSLVLSGTNLWSQPDDASRLTVRSPPTTSFAVTSYSFSPNPITLGQSGNANISITGGTAGTYTLIIWRGISLWPDEQVTTFQIAHTGATTTKSFPFTPAIAASYHMSLVLSGTNLWSQPDDASRLTVRSPPTTSFAVTSYSFSPNPITLGQSGNANISITGGTAGTYTLIIWRGISLWPDEQVTTFQITHAGTTTTKSFPFTAAMAASYHMSLVLSGTNLWSQPDDASRLTVRSPPTTSFAVTSYSFSPNPITLGQSGNANISITGGTAGTYTLIIWRGISLWPDEQVTTFQIAHAGTTTTKSFPFTAAMAASYHMSLVLSGTNLWSQPDDASRLTVRSPPTTSFAVTSYSFSPNPITLGASTNANITITGGTAGTYTLCVWRGISLWPDEQVTSYQVNHNGQTTTKTVSFTAISTGSYHLGIDFNGGNLWGQPNDASRLKVTQVPPTVKIEGVDVPSVLLVGHPYRYNVALRNSGSAQATVSLSIDSSVTGHVSTTPVTLLPNTITNIPVTTTFTPTGPRKVTYSILFGDRTIDSLTRDVEVKAAVSSSPNWRQNIQPGDILLSRSGSFLSVIQAWLGSFWTHAGIYVGDGKVMEALGDGVSLKDITSWDYNPGAKKEDSKSCVGLLRVPTANPDQINTVVSFAKGQLAKPYSIPIPLLVSKTADPKAPAWYCSELAWAAYKQIGIDIEYTPDLGLVWPQEIDDDEDTESIGLHVESVPGPDTLIPPSFLILHMHSPADLVVTDPDGLVVSSNLNQVAEAMYIVDDFDGNGDVEAIVGIRNSKVGDYRIGVTPKAGTSPTDTYSLEAGVAGQRTWLANDMPMSSIPNQGFTLMVGVPPSINAGQATSVGADVADLSGNLNSLGTASLASVSFQWGTVSGSYAFETAAQTMKTNDTFSSRLLGLSPNTRYYYRAKGVGYGITYSAEGSFVTLEAAPPASRAGAPSGSNAGGAGQPVASISWMTVIVVGVIGMSAVIAAIGVVAVVTRRKKQR